MNVGTAILPIWLQNCAVPLSKPKRNVRLNICNRISISTETLVKVGPVCDDFPLRQAIKTANKQLHNMQVCRPVKNLKQQPFEVCFTK